MQKNQIKNVKKLLLLWKLTISDELISLNGLFEKSSSDLQAF